jgi:hypothetical protein
MLPVDFLRDLSSVENDRSENWSELAPELSEVYRQMERTHALHLDVSEVILSCSSCTSREWIQVTGPDERTKL